MERVGAKAGRNTDPVELAVWKGTVHLNFKAFSYCLLHVYCALNKPTHSNHKCFSVFQWGWICDGRLRQLRGLWWEWWDSEMLWSDSIGHYLAALKPLEQNILETRKTAGNQQKPYVTLCQVLSNHKCSKVAMSAEEIRRNPFVRLEA